MKDIQKTTLFIVLTLLALFPFVVFLSKHQPLHLSLFYLRILLGYLLLWIMYYSVMLLRYKKKQNYPPTKFFPRIAVFTYIVENHPEDKTYTLLRIMNIIGAFFFLVTVVVYALSLP